MAINPNTLIQRFGGLETLNDKDVYIYIDTGSVSFWNKDHGYKEYSDSKFIVVFLKEEVLAHDVFKIKGTKYFVYKSMEVLEKNTRIYTKVILYRDDFTRAMTVHNQIIQRDGGNVSSEKKSLFNVWVRVKTTNSRDYLDMPTYSGAEPTHVFYILTYRIIKKGMRIKWGLRNFDVVSSINVDERNKLQKIFVAEKLG